MGWGGQAKNTKIGKGLGRVLEGWRGEGAAGLSTAPQPGVRAYNAGQGHRLSLYLLPPAFTP